MPGSLPGLLPDLHRFNRQRHYAIQRAELKARIHSRPGIRAALERHSSLAGAGYARSKELPAKLTEPRAQQAVLRSPSGGLFLCHNSIPRTDSAASGQSRSQIDCEEFVKPQELTVYKPLITAPPAPSRTAPCSPAARAPREFRSAGTPCRSPAEALCGKQISAPRADRPAFP